MIHREMERWADMLASCYQPADASWYSNGKFGVNVCDDWLFFEKFVADVGPMPGMNSRLDRVPGSMQFNKITTAWRTTRDRYLVLNGESRSIQEWSSRLGIPLGTIFSRLSQNRSVEEVLSRSRLPRRDISDRQFGLLAVMSFSRVQFGRDFWNCRCVCGTRVEVAAWLLHKGVVRSCGCLPSATTKRCTPGSLVCIGVTQDTVAAFSKKYDKRPYDVAKDIRDGLTPSQALGIEKRPTRNVGTRELSRLTGIPEGTIANRKNKGYCPKQQRSILRLPTGKLWEYDGLCMTIDQWATHLGVEKHKILQRLYAGWPFDEILRSL